MKNLWACGLLLASLTSCTKNEAVKPAENPITTLLSEQAPALTLVQIRGNSFREMGVVFSSAVAGKLTQVGSQLPDAGIYAVTIWDFDSGQLLQQKTVEQEVPDKLTLIDTDVMPLTINKKYVISINNKSGVRPQGAFTQAFKKSGGNILPDTKGSITLHGSRYSSSSIATFPTTTLNQFSLLNGVPEFTFIPD
ncbi:DUF4082 domain-containing protein [Spirosoma fluviale]|nr:DUF4082 domain-containing protein [Spirosoma fluviale]